VCEKFGSSGFSQAAGGAPLSGLGKNADIEPEFAPQCSGKRGTRVQVISHAQIRNLFSATNKRTLVPAFFPQPLFFFVHFLEPVPTKSGRQKKVDPVSSGSVQFHKTEVRHEVISHIFLSIATS
jgi:hypothetical protein